MLHGKADTSVPQATSKALGDEMKVAGYHCEIVGFHGQPHGFFNYGFADNRYFIDTLKEADECPLLAWLSHRPTAGRAIPETVGGISSHNRTVALP
jgi:dienelactone hydrolase